MDLYIDCNRCAPLLNLLHLSNTRELIVRDSHTDTARDSCVVRDRFAMFSSCQICTLLNLLRLSNIHDVINRNSCAYTARDSCVVRDRFAMCSL